MPGARYIDSTTLRTPAEGPVEPLSPASTWTLTILWHPSFDRIGDVALLGPDAPALHVSRRAPRFVKPGTLEGAPLEDPFLSRTPIVISPLSDADETITIEGGVGGTALEIDGKPAPARATFAVVDLRRGVVLTLAGRIALLLHLSNGLPRVTEHGGLIGASDEIARVHNQLRRLPAADDVSVLIRGETGTGKELVAHAIHAGSARASKPFVAVNLASIPAPLMSSELFGHKKGAFTGADSWTSGYFLRAEGGTLFLDEIGAMPVEAQGVLLRALQEKVITQLGGGRTVSVDVRIVAATDARLDQMVADGRFSPALYHRLAGHVIRLPALRERRDDIARLLAHFLEREMLRIGHADRLRHPADAAPWLDARSVARLVAYAWPGNVRELENAARSLAVHGGGAERTTLPEELEGVLSAAAQSHAPPPPAASPNPPRVSSLSEIGDDVIAAALQRCRGNVRAAARELGISPNSFYRRIDGIDHLRAGREIDAPRLEAALDEHQGDLGKVAETLGLSVRALAQRIRKLGVGGGSRAR